MSNMSLRVVARVAAKANSVEQVRAILMGVVEPTRREPGCLSYQLLQSQADPTDFTCIEEWASAAAEQSILQHHTSRTRYDNCQDCSPRNRTSVATQY